MDTIDELKMVVDQSDIEDKKKVKNQLNLLSKLPGEYNQQVFDKLYELAMYDPKAITIFIDQFIETSQKLIEKK